MLNETKVTRLLKDMKKQGRQTIEKRRPELIKALECMGSFYMELRWDFQSWIPLLSRILPSDICKIYKKGANIRLDTTLVDFNDMKWERGDVSFLFTGKGSPVRSRNRFSPTDPSSKTNSHSLIVMDNRLKVYQKVKQDETENEIEDEVDVLMSSDIVSAQLNTKSMCFTRVSSGWFFKTEKREHVGPFLSDFYLISGFTVESRKRREHLTEEDLQKNRAIIESLTRHPPQQNGSNGSLTGSQPQPIANMGDQVVQSELLYHRRPSLMPPISKRPISWEEYISFPEGFNPPLGRTQVAKMSSKSFKATLAMSQDFPMTIDSLLNVLEIVAPFKQFKKLREFVEMKLPPGFPVKIGELVFLFNTGYIEHCLFLQIFLSYPRSPPGSRSRSLYTMTRSQTSCLKCRPVTRRIRSASPTYDIQV